VFLGGSRTGGTVMQPMSVRIYKSTGKVEYFCIPPIANQHLLKKGKVIYASIYSKFGF